VSCSGAFVLAFIWTNAAVEGAEGNLIRRLVRQYRLRRLLRAVTAPL